MKIPTGNAVGEDSAVSRQKTLFAMKEMKMRLIFSPRYVSKTLKPRRATEIDAGYDVVADIPDAITVQPLMVTPIPTGIWVDSRVKGEYIRIAPKSGLALKHGVQVLAGVVDAGYKQEIIVLLTSLNSFVVKPGDKIAQFILEKCGDFEGDVVGGEAIRVGGFGSTN